MKATDARGTGAASPTDVLRSDSALGSDCTSAKDQCLSVAASLQTEAPDGAEAIHLSSTSGLQVPARSTSGLGNEEAIALGPIARGLSGLDICDGAGEQDAAIAEIHTLEGRLMEMSAELMTARSQRDSSKQKLLAVQRALAASEKAAEAAGSRAVALEEELEELAGELITAHAMHRTLTDSGALPYPPKSPSSCATIPEGGDAAHDIISELGDELRHLVEVASSTEAQLAASESARLKAEQDLAVAQQALQQLKLRPADVQPSPEASAHDSSRDARGLLYEQLKALLVEKDAELSRSTSACLASEQNLAAARCCIKDLEQALSTARFTTAEESLHRQQLLAEAVLLREELTALVAAVSEKAARLEASESARAEASEARDAAVQQLLELQGSLTNLTSELQTARCELADHECETSQLRLAVSNKDDHLRQLGQRYADATCEMSALMDLASEAEQRDAMYKETVAELCNVRLQRDEATRQLALSRAELEETTKLIWQKDKALATAAAASSSRPSWASHPGAGQAPQPAASGCPVADPSMMELIAAGKRIRELEAQLKGEQSERQATERGQVKLGRRLQVLEADLCHSRERLSESQQQLSDSASKLEESLQERCRESAEAQAAFEGLKAELERLTKSKTQPTVVPRQDMLSNSEAA